MAGVTVTGLSEMRAAVTKLEPAVTDALRKVARDTAVRVMNRAKALVPVDTGLTRDAISIEPHVDRRYYAVGVFASQPHQRKGRRTTRTAFLPNLDIWIEFGTGTKAARPFLRPSLDAETARYSEDMQQAAESAAAAVLG